MQTFLGVFLSFALAQLTSNFVLFVFFFQLVKLAKVLMGSYVLKRLLSMHSTSLILLCETSIISKLIPTGITEKLIF